MNWILVAVVMAISAMAVIADTAVAQSVDLGGTSWTSTNNACDVDGVDFRSDGTADVYDLMTGDEDTAHWTLDGDALHLKYDSWYGGIEGSIYNGNRLEANRPAVEWILDQFKESKPKDQTVRQKFNTYRFSEHKKKMIDLIMRVTRVSVRTQEIVTAMKKAHR